MIQFRLPQRGKTENNPTQVPRRGAQRGAGYNNPLNLEEVAQRLIENNHSLV